MTVEKILEWIKNYSSSVDTQKDLEIFQRELIELINELDFDVTEDGTKYAIGYAGGTGLNGKKTNGGIYQTVELIAHAESSNFVFINDAADNFLNNSKVKDALIAKVGNDNYAMLFWGDEEGKSFGKNSTLNEVISHHFMNANASGDVMLLIAENASVDSVLRKTEIPIILEKKSVTSILGIPREQLLKMDEIDRFNLLKEKSIALQSEATIYRGIKDEVTYEILSFEGTSLENTFKVDVPEDMKAVGKYYERVDGLLSRDAIIAKYGLQDMLTDEADNIINTLKIAEYRASKNEVSAECLVKFSFDDDAKLIKATLIDDVVDVFPTNNELESVIEVSATAYLGFMDDASLSDMIGKRQYNVLTEFERLELKELVYNASQISGNNGFDVSDEGTYLSKVVGDYLKDSGKLLDSTLSEQSIEILDWIEAYDSPLETTEDLAKFQGELIEKIKKLDFDVTDGGKKVAIGYAGGTGISGDNANGGVYQTVELIAHADDSNYVFINDSADNLLNNKEFKALLVEKIGEKNYTTLLWGDKGESFGANLPLNDVVSKEFMQANASGDVMLLIAENASVDSVLRKTEIPTLLAMEDTVTSILGIPRNQLLAMNEIDRFNLLKEKSIAMQAEATIYQGTRILDSGDEIVYEILSFEGTSLENTFKVDVPEGMEAVGQYYERVDGLLSKDTIIAKYGLQDMLVDEADNIINTLKIAEYRGYKENVSVEALVKFSFNEDAKIIKATLIEDVVDAFPTNKELESVMDVSASAYLNFMDDVSLSDMVGNEQYEALTELEKLEVKETVYNASQLVGNNVLDVIDDAAYSSRVVDDYLKASGKSIDSLNSVDKSLIKLADGISGNKTFDTPKYLKTMDKYSGIVKKIEVGGTILDVACETVFFVSSISQAVDAYNNGESNKAAGILTGAATEFAVSTAGGWALTTALTPYLAGFGAAIGGPIGAAVGTLLSCAIGYGLAGFLGSDLNEKIVDRFSELDDDYGSAGSAVRYVADPLVFDLDGDGFESLSVENGVHFDEDNLGLKEKTEWISADDAMLAMDLDKNGSIDDGAELFGTSTLLADGSHASSGFEALAQYDENGDGVIDEKDVVFSNLLVWQDKNTDGISQAEELNSLQNHGMESISLNAIDDNGTNVATVTYRDGSAIRIGELFFGARLYDTAEKTEIEISDEIKELPNVRAMGNVASLHSLMQQDESGRLKDYVTQFSQATATEEKEQIVSKILYFITGAENVASNSRGGQFDGQKLTVIEELMGKDFVGTAGSNPVNTAAPILEGMYQDIFEIYYSLLNAETFLKEYMGMTFWMVDEAGNKYLDTSIFDAYVAVRMEEGTDMKDVVSQMGRYIASINTENSNNFANYVLTYADNREYVEAIAKYSRIYVGVGSNENDTLTGNSGDLLMLGFAGDDKITTGNGTDQLYGGEGNDTLNGGCGNDVLYGESGNDMLYGGYGDDMLYGGEGNDTLYGEVGNDVLYGEEGNDTLYGSNGNNTLTGGTGNDTLYGGYGADTYYIGAEDGNDVINNDDSGSDRVNDRIVFGEGIKAEDISLYREKDDLLIRNEASGQITRIKNQFYRNCYNLENIEFADGTVWTRTDLEEKLALINGTDGNDKLVGYGSVYGYNGNEVFYAGAGDDTVTADAGNDVLYGESGNDMLYGGYGDDMLHGGKENDILYGEAGNDVLYGENGNDILYGGYGADTYLFGKGDGADVIQDYDSTSGITDKLMVDYSHTELVFERNGLDLLVSAVDTTDSVTVQNHYQNNNYKVEEIYSNDGYVLSCKQVDLLIQSMATFETENGMSWEEGILTNNEDVANITLQTWVKQDVE